MQEKQCGSKSISFLKKHPKITFFSVLPPFRGGIAQFSEELRKSLLKKTEVESFTFQKQYPDFLFPGQSQFDEEEKTESPGVYVAINGLEIIGNEYRFSDDGKRPFKISIDS